MNSACRALISAYEQVDTAWAAYCEAHGEKIKAVAKMNLAAEKYKEARKNWQATVQSITPGEIEEKKNDPRNNSTS